MYQIQHIVHPMHLMNILRWILFKQLMMSNPYLKKECSTPSKFMASIRRELSDAEMKTAYPEWDRGEETRWG